MAMNPFAALMGGGPQRPASIQVRPPQAGGGGGDASASIKRIIADIHQTVPQLDDEGDKQTLLKCLAAIQGILATEQKEKEAALGTTPAHKYMAKAAKGGGGY